MADTPTTTTIDNSVTNVAAGKPRVAGAIYIAPTTATLPTDATTALGSSFKCLGYVSEDGLTNGTAKDTTLIKAWGGDVVLAADGGITDTFKFKLLEVLNLEVLKFIYGSANVSGSLSAGVEIGVASNSEVEEHILVVETVLRGAVKRMVIPRAIITELAEVAYKDTEAVGYEVTTTALPGTDGKTHKEYIKAA